MRCRSFFFFLWMIASVKPGKAGTGPNQLLRTDSVFSLCSKKGYVPSLVHDFGNQLTSPLHMKTRQWLAFGTVAAVTAVLIHFDSDIDQEFRYLKSRNDLIRVTSPQLSELGNNYGYGLVAGCGVAGLLVRDRKLFQTALLASQAMITSGVWVRLIKYSTSRERPSASYSLRGHPGGHWYGFFKEYDPELSEYRDISYFDAFPSGHTSTAFAIATVFSMQYGDHRAVPIISYTLATLVGISRLTEHTHWASDVLVGGCAGYLCARQVVRYHRKLFEEDATSFRRQRKKAVIRLLPSDRLPGINFSMLF